ncbi:fused MFS/spermidine synthase [Desulfatiglans anilini]|uniref:fused MFS/spermidine synthase n=1 Tax=Desulfatiglans anilini TaxID=90728 RepID=UPI00041A7C9A|nr:fused MFS/spermidine synthase [Desulfatiglans anilini]
MMKISILTLACFFFSGLAGLIYQVIWVRLLDKVMGSAPFAVATVLTVFMGGLALGSYWAGRLIDRGMDRRRLLLLYGKLEGLIGLYGLLIPLLLVMLKPLYAAAYRNLYDSFWPYTAIAFLGCALILIIPTAFMGATLPILCRFYVEALDHLGKRTGSLYGLNTVGAAAGAFLTGFYLIEAFGLWGSVGVAAGLNGLVAVACFAAGRRNGPLEEKRGRAVKRAEARVKPPAALEGAPVWPLWIFGVSGFCAMAYEVFWTRLLGLLLGPTPYSFALVVGTFIVGLAVGALVFGWVADRSGGAGWLLGTQAAAALSALFVSHLLGNSQVFFAKLIYTLKDDFGAMVWSQSLLLFALMLGPTILWGAAFPLVNRLTARSVETIGGSVGKAYAFNTVGAILGSLCAGFVLLPFLGKAAAIRSIGGLQLAVALVSWIVWSITDGRSSRRFALGAGLAGAGLSVFISWHVPSWERQLLSYGRYHNFRAVAADLERSGWLDALLRGGQVLARHEEGREVVFFEDGPGGFTTVERMVDSLGVERFTLLNSGKPDASSHGDRSTQTLLAHVPLLFHPGARTVMVLGLASGMTAGEVLHYPVERVDVLEINSAVIEAARFFEPWNNGCLDDPRCRLIMQDGRNHLALSDERYDVIISEPSNPWMAGLANLYTREFFSLVSECLRDDGIFVQWIHSYEMDWDTFAMVGRTFAAVFPEGVLFTTLTGGGDYLLVGAKGRAVLDFETAGGNLRYAALSKNMVLPDARVLSNLVVAENLQTLFGTGPLHTDNRPLLEFAAPRVLHVSDTGIEERIAARGTISSRTRAVVAGRDPARAVLDLIEFGASVGNPLFGVVDPGAMAESDRGRYTGILDAYCEREAVSDYSELPEGLFRQRCAETQAALIRAHLRTYPEDAGAWYSLGLALGVAGDSKGEVEAFEEAVSLDPLHAKAWNNLGIAYMRNGVMDEAENAFLRSVRVAPTHANAYFNLAQVQLEKQDFKEAERYLEEGLKQEEHPRARALLQEIRAR